MFIYKTFIMKKVLCMLLTFSGFIFINSCTKSGGSPNTATPAGSGTGTGAPTGTTAATTLCKDYELTDINGAYDEVYNFNDSGQLIKYTDKKQGATYSFTYDALGRRQNVAGFTYDYLLGNISKVSFSVDGSYTMIVTKTMLDTLYTSTDLSSFKSSYVYNSGGDATQISVVINHSTYDSSTEYTYKDADGTYAFGITYSDSLSNLNNDPLVHFTNLTLWTGSLLVSKHLPSGFKESFSGNAYSETGTVSPVKFTLSGSFQYAYDSHNRVTQISETIPGSSSKPAWNIKYLCN
jgi:YD repeat-containing protein